MEIRNTLLTNFVKFTCEGRDESHGFRHMEAVVETATIIAISDYIDHYNFNNIMLDVITVAWLHDIADHKYDHDGLLEKKLDNFGFTNIPNFEDIKRVIKLISFSSENKAILANKPINYEEILGSYYRIIRDIVSDADKIEAIGSIGIKRCIEYIKHINPKINETELSIAVKKHADEKLLRLKDEFIRTTTGKKIATSLHNEMVELLKSM
jgi:uncharacterized protein